MGLIVFFTGYQPACHGDNVHSMKGCGGSEIAFIETAHELHKLGHTIHVFSPMYRDQDERECQGVTFRHEKHMEKFMQENDIDAFIISRYIYPLFAFRLKYKKMFIWMHDLTLQPWFNTMQIPLYGSLLVYNMLPLIEKIVYVSDFQRWNNDLACYFKMPLEKTCIIGNGLSQKLIDQSFQNQIAKKPFSFIWCSNQSRGLTNLAKLWPRLSQRIKEEFNIIPTLTICGAPCEPLDLDIEMLSITYPETVTNLGKITQQNMFELMNSAHVWFYPTNFHETYCMVAKEAQLAGCICIAADIGALKETLGNYGTIYNRDLNDEKVIELVIDTLKKPFDKQSMINHVKQETWSQRALQWEKLIFS